MQAGQEAGNWSPLVEVIHTLDAHRVVEAIDQIYEQHDQEHLILIDTFGGGSESRSRWIKVGGNVTGTDVWIWYEVFEVVGPASTSNRIWGRGQRYA
jgi:hypothetical protein